MAKVTLERFKEFHIKGIEVTEVQNLETETLILNYKDSHFLSAYFSKGKLQKWHGYKTETIREESNRFFINSELKKLEAKAQRKEELKGKKLKMAEKIQVGTILYSSWGYEQTNVDFYQVIEKRGLKVVIHGIGYAESKESGFMTYEVTAQKDAFIGEPTNHIISAYGIRLSSFQHLSIWDGKPKTKTTYA